MVNVKSVDRYGSVQKFYNSILKWSAGNRRQPLLPSFILSHSIRINVFVTNWMLFIVNLWWPCEFVCNCAIATWEKAVGEIRAKSDGVECRVDVRHVAFIMACCNIAPTLRFFVATNKQTKCQFFRATHSMLSYCPHIQRQTSFDLIKFHHSNSF